MAQTKKKNEVSTKKQAKQLVVPSSTVKSTTKADLVAYWRSEIEALKQESFSSEEAAIKAIAKKVVARLRLSAKQAAQTEAFLVALMEKNPNLSREMRRSLRIST